jgi:hypothetical protein
VKIFHCILGKKIAGRDASPWLAYSVKAAAALPNAVPFQINHSITVKMAIKKVEE